MSAIENIFLRNDCPVNQPHQKNRRKMGEIFQLPNERYALVCIHCSEEFQYFSEFTLHVQDHFQRLLSTEELPVTIPTAFIKNEADLDDDSNKVAEVLEVFDEKCEIGDAINSAPVNTNNDNYQIDNNNIVKPDKDYSDDDYNDFMNDCVNDSESDEADEEEKSQSEAKKIKENTLNSIEETRQPKVRLKPKPTAKPRPKPPKKLKIDPNAASQVYDELLAKFANSQEDPMDPVKFELFKAEKVDGLFPCTIKDTPEVRMMATLSVHSHKYDKIGKEFLCPVCESKFPNPASVRRHLFTHVKEPVFLCGFCSEKFRAIRYLRSHLKQKHQNETRSFECFLCHKEFPHTQFRALKDHIQTHQIESMHCMLCNKKFKEYRFYQLHMMNIHPEGINIKSDNHLPLEPIDYRAKPVISAYECYVCRKDFRERRLLRSHMKLHTQQPRLCLVCGIFCSSATSLSRHMKLHNSDETKSHLCTICGKGFKIRQYLLRHNRKEHQLWADNTPPVCQICGAYFDKKSLLHEHMKTHPFEETRNFICTICNHAARNAYNLKRHLQTHSADRSFECPVCQKTFHPRYAKDHMKSHTEARKHKCPDCGKRFKRKYALKQHMYQHGGAPEHKCDICGRAFARTDKLLRHRRRHGIPLNYHCKICLKGFISQKSYQLHESGHMKSQAGETSETGADSNQTNAEFLD